MLAAVNSTAGLIPTRSEKQAMDWSLVLVSQGIETVIEHDPATADWVLRVEQPDYTRALQTLRQYTSENRRRFWRQELPWTGLIFDWRCGLWFLFLILLFAVEATGRGHLSWAGMMDNQAVQAGAWWRLFTAVTLHGDVAHLAANAATGFLLVGLATGAFGPGPGLLLPYLAGVAGNLAGLLVYPATHRGLGASGMVMGALGLLAAQWLALLKHGLTAKDLAVRGVLSGGLLLTLLGFNPAQNVDVLAHVVGFAAGLALGATLAFGPPAWHQSPRFNRIALAAFIGLVAVTWWLALRAA
jgi:membrane associated rhomboid family serine protease